MKHKIEKLFWADLCIALLGVFVDQFTKYLAVTYLKDQPAIPLIPGVLEAGAIDRTDGCARAAALAEKI